MIHNIYRDFEDGALVTALGFDIIIQRRSLGTLALPSGKLVACDPLTHPGTEAFDADLPPGEYPVRLVIAQLRDEARIAYAILELDPEPAKRWQLATVPGEDTSRMSRDEHGYAVISSLGCFMDAETATHLIEYGELAPIDEDEIERELRGQLRRSRRSEYAWANISHPYLGDGNIAVFTAGYGEGLYRTYLGHTPEGKLTRVVTDFEVLEMRFPSFGF